MNRWIVQRAGSATGGYGRGWFAMNRKTEVGAWFPTWHDALDHACRQALIEAVAAA